MIAAVARLRAGACHWTPARWAAPADGPLGAELGPETPRSTRADLMHSLVQRIADLAAGAEGQPLRDIPRLGNDLALCDQLQVVVADLVAAQPAESAIAEALDLVRRVDQAL